MGVKIKYVKGLLRLCHPSLVVSGGESIEEINHWDGLGPGPMAFGVLDGDAEIAFHARRPRAVLALRGELEVCA